MTSGFRSVHPFAAFIYFAGMTILTMVLFHPLFLLAAFLFMILLNVMLDSAKRLRKWIGLYLLTGAVVFVINPLFSHRGSHILFYFQDNPITLEAVAYGASMALTVLTLFVTFAAYNLIITPIKFLYLFSRLSAKGALLMMMAMRFVPLLGRRLTQIAVVQRTRGIDPLQGSLRKRMKDGMTQLQILLTWSLEESMQSADSMNARGYGTGQRSTYDHFKMDRRDRLLISQLLVMFAVCLGGSFFGSGKLVIYPEMDSFAMHAGDWLVFGSFCLFMFIPIALEGRERLKWRSLK